ncbi:PIG-L family deacetylase [Betaproteobacteria bacterium LSUCC0117]|nr:PIG-L family deacetylase [Betaproteobacteria bacterium LSUCC0117]
MSHTERPPFLDHVEAYLRAFDTPVNERPSSRSATPAEPKPNAPVCAIFSPHPDDEAIMGGVALRLANERGWRVVNVAVTLGSRLDRRAPRWAELTDCCRYLGFELVAASGTPGVSLEGVSPSGALQETEAWQHAVNAAVEILATLKPRVIICPHELDGHPAHVATYHLVKAAIPLALVGPVDVLLSEYWNTQMHPKLAVQLEPQSVATLMQGLAFHVGEVARNPYHLLLPVWFMDSARRGAERVASVGGDSLGFPFAALYGWLRWNCGEWSTPQSAIWRANDAVWPLQLED